MENVKAKTFSMVLRECMTCKIIIQQREEKKKQPSKDSETFRDKIYSVNGTTKLHLLSVVIIIVNMFPNK